MIDPTLDAISRESQRSVESHLADYEAKLRAARRDPAHVRSTLGYIKTVACATGWETVADITADAATHYARELTDRGKSARTVQAYLIALRSFTKWLVSNQKLPRDPLSSVRKPNPKADRRYERRMLLPEEWLWLKGTTLTSPKRYGMAGGERALLYATAIQTGLRSSELRSLTRGRLFLDSEPPYVMCKAGSTKNRQDARQYIQRNLATELRQHVATKAPQAPVFDLPHESDMAAMLRSDLSDARKAWMEEALCDEEHTRREQSDFLVNVNHEASGSTFTACATLAARGCR